MFGKDPAAETILEELRGLKRSLAKLEGERDAAREEIGLADQVVTLKKTLTDLEIKHDRVKEQHEREKREVEHMVGLEKKRQTFEVDSAKRDAVLSVREENLTADKDRFAEQMKFQDDRFKSEVKYLKDLMGQILERLPTINVEKTIGAKR